VSQISSDEKVQDSENSWNLFANDEDREVKGRSDDERPWWGLESHQKRDKGVTVLGFLKGH
jgi:polyphosphate kinase 2 (PPK2 family)